MHYNSKKIKKDIKLKFSKKSQFTHKKQIKLKKNNNISPNQIIISGKHATIAALRNSKRKLSHLISTQDQSFSWLKEVKDLDLNIEVKIKKKDELDEINNFKPHQNIILVTEPLKRISLESFLSNRFNNSKKPIRIIILDQVTDPQNVGAIIRSAHAFKMDGLALSQRNSPLESASMSKASSGAIEKLEIIELSNMSREIQKLQNLNFNVYGLEQSKKTDIFELEKETGNVAIILGSEGLGLRRLTKEKVDKLITIPINEDSESLNVANAASIAMFQLQKNIIKS